MTFTYRLYQHVMLCANITSPNKCLHMDEQWLHRSSFKNRTNHKHENWLPWWHE